ncbi:TetR/AcrR family transcriptional regulator [Janibacter cremeus]|uniref:TetR/AcrR family transcriptional regulator n=1 Tax=Janibacter cremeus TaxID=1285192 RepID=UPI0023F76CDF|nr:TetR/AcrR family transcriptional regulator [Janibacter cremeus]WEV79819.1 TetR/AcrR family transcriptional regulator [Janibacter cremeus]
MSTSERSTTPDAREPGLASRDRILIAAAEVARERGVTGATVAAICKRSGLPVSSLYWHFTDKDALFAEVVRTSFARWLAESPGWTSRSDDVLDHVAELLRTTEETLRRKPSFMNIGMQVLLEDGDDTQQTRQAYLDVRAQALTMMTVWLERALSDLRDPQLVRDVAILFRALSDGLVVAGEAFDDLEAMQIIDLFVPMIQALLRRAIASGSRP